MNYITDMMQHHTVNLVVTPEDLMDFVKAYCQQKGLMLVDVHNKQEKDTQQLYLDETEVMKRLRVSRTTLWRWRNDGYLVPVKVGKFNRYAVADVEKIEEGYNG